MAKIPISNAFSELVEMDFVDYGDLSTFLRIRATFSRFSAIMFLWAKKQEEQTAEMVRGVMISNWLAVFGAPAIMVADKDSGFIGEVFRNFAQRVTYFYKR